MREGTIIKLIIHHSFSPDNPFRKDWEGIRRYHRSLGWSDVGYHYGIELVENDYLIMRGRPDYVIGAHCLGQNRSSLGIVAIGNFDEDIPPLPLYEKIAKLCCSLIHKHPTINAIEPHSKYSKKTCPGINFNMEQLLSLVEIYKHHDKSQV